VQLRAPSPATRRPAAATAQRTAPGPAPAPDRPAPVGDAVKIVAWLSLAAGVIHAIAMIDHFSHWWLYGAFFLVLTYGQVLWGIALLRKPASDRSLKIGALANLAICVVWLYSRTIGVPIGPDAGRPEAVGTMDVAATLDQLALALYVALVLRPDLRVARGLKGLLGVHRIRIGMMLSSATVFAALLGGHSH
jgi:hypothetical protein